MLKEGNNTYLSDIFRNLGDLRDDGFVFKKSGRKQKNLIKIINCYIEDFGNQLCSPPLEEIIRSCYQTLYIISRLKERITIEVLKPRALRCIVFLELYSWNRLSRSSRTLREKCETEGGTCPILGANKGGGGCRQISGGAVELGWASQSQIGAAKARRFLALNFHRSSFCRAHVNLKRASKLISSEDAFSVIMKQVNKLASFAPKWKQRAGRKVEMMKKLKCDSKGEVEANWRSLQLFLLWR